MKLVTTLLVAAALTGYDIQLGKRSPDGYEFEGKEFNNIDTKIEFVVHPSYSDLHKSAAAAGVKDARSVKAYSVLQKPDYKKCTVHIIDPDVVYAPEYIGHEIVHCIYGRWHDRTIIMNARKSSRSDNG